MKAAVISDAAMAMDALSAAATLRRFGIPTDYAYGNVRNQLRRLDKAGLDWTVLFEGGEIRLRHRDGGQAVCEWPDIERGLFNYYCMDDDFTPLIDSLIPDAPAFPVEYGGKAVGMLDA